MAAAPLAVSSRVSKTPAHFFLCQQRRRRLGYAPATTYASGAGPLCGGVVGDIILNRTWILELVELLLLSYKFRLVSPRRLTVAARDSKPTDRIGRLHGRLPTAFFCP